ncbi:MAG: TolC family protein [Bacteroidetes bacterium]|nr:TolC family protein [Bacteroidota bacterium]
MKRFFLLLAMIPMQLIAQEKDLSFFVQSGLQNNPTLLENTNLAQYFSIQKEIIAAQNKKPQVSATGDYLFAPFFNDNGKVISITDNPSAKAFGYNAGITNGGLYAAQVNVAVNILNKGVINNLYAQNNIQAKVTANSSLQIKYDVEKNITDQYIITYQFLQQTYYLQHIIDMMQNRKPLVAALVQKGLLQQNDFLLLDIQLQNAINDLKQMQYAYKNGIELLKNFSLIKDTTTYVLQKPEIFILPDPAQRYYQQKFELDSLNLIAQQNVFNNKYKPQVSILGSGGINATNLTNAYRNVGVSAAVHVAIPISDGRQRKFNNQTTSILINNQKLYRDNASLLLESNLRNAKQQIEQWKASSIANSELIQKQQLLLDIIKDKVVSGQVTVMDYINALQEYSVMQKNKAIAETNILLYIILYNYYNH